MNSSSPTEALVLRLLLQAAQQKHVLCLAALVRLHLLVTSFIQLVNEHVLCEGAGKRVVLGNPKSALIVEAPLVGIYQHLFPLKLSILYVLYLFPLSDASFNER